MKIEIEITKKEQATVEVEFPLFLKYGDTFESGGWYECYARVDETMNRHTIIEDMDGKWEYSSDRVGPDELGRIVKADPSGLSGYLYREITADQFYAKVEELRDALAGVPR